MRHLVHLAIAALVVGLAHAAAPGERPGFAGNLGCASSRLLISATN
jgi:hypothetical protein